MIVGGVEITGTSPHFAQRAMERGISTETIESVLTDYSASVPGNPSNPDSRNYIRDGIWVTLQNDGELKTVIDKR
jgi:hypothetical protein